MMIWRVSDIPAILTLALLCLTGSPIASAQPLQPGAPLSSVQLPDVSISVPFDQQDEDGNPVTEPSPPAPKTFGKAVLPNDGVLQKYLELLTRLRGPESSVNSVQLDGTVKGDRAEITATVSVQIHHEEGWVRVPLFFNEAVIRKTETSFTPDNDRKVPGIRPGPSAAKGESAYSDFTRDGGYRWWFRGKGFHQLKLTLIVPVNRTVGSRRLQLALPPLSPSSTLKLRVPETRVSATERKNTVVEVEPVGKTSSVIKATGMQGLLDLQWKSLPAGKQQFLQSESAMLVNLTEETVELTVWQRVQSTRELKTLTVLIPPGYRPVSAEGKTVEKFDFQESTRRATVTLTAAPIDPAEIKWILEKALPARGGRLTVEALQIDKADKQSIELAVAKVPGWRIEKLDDNNGSVRRIRLTEFSRRDIPERVPLMEAYRFHRPPYAISFQASPIQPHMTATPKFRLSVNGKQILLEGEFHIRISEEGGAIHEVTLQWPGWKTAGWKILPTNSSSLFRQQVVDDGGNSMIRYRLTGSRRGEFLIPIQAELAVDTQKRMAIRLPSIAADIVQPGELEVTRSPAVVLDLTDAEDVPLTELPGETGDLVDRYRLDPATVELSAKATVFSQKLTARSFVELDPKTLGLTSRQRITLNAEYVPLVKLSLGVPAEYADRFTVYDADGKETKTLASVGMDGTSLIEVRLKKPVLGTIELVVEHSAALSKELAPGELATLPIPVAVVSDIPFDTFEFRTKSSDSLVVSFLDDNWRRTRTLDGSLKWTPLKPESLVSVTLQKPAVPQSAPYSITRGLIRVDVDHSGLSRFRAQYRTETAPRAIVVTIPEVCTLDDVWWGKQKISDQVSQVTVRSGVALRIPLPVNGPSNGLLTIDYHCLERNSNKWLRQFDLPTPRFPANVWIDQLLWSTTLPADEHLASYSENYFGEFRWQRNGIIWQRDPMPAFDDVDKWISAVDGPEAGAGISGNRYVFRRFGTSAPLKVTAVSRSAMVLFGAGLAWLVGVLLVRIPRLRSAFVLLTVVLLIAIASLQFPSECQLLIQPACLGFLLAGAFVWIDRRYRPLRTPSPMAMANPRDFVVAPREEPSSVRSQPGVIVGSEEPTVHGLETAEPVSSVPGIRRPG